MSDPKPDVDVTDPPPVPVRLDIGCGETPLDGWTGVDRVLGVEAFPLPWADETVDEIRAVHVLEHFSYRQSAAVLADWARVLKPNGRLRVAVPDFGRLVDAYTGPNPDELPIEAIIMGAHSTPDDRHAAIFDESKLGRLLVEAGFGAIAKWETTVGDGAAHPATLNLEGRKGAPVAPGQTGLQIAAVMSVPRLGFMDNFFCVFQSLLPHRIPFHKFTGAFWGQCIERGIEVLLDRGCDAILAIDYDSVFSAANVGALKALLEATPDAAAVCAMQQRRCCPYPLLTQTMAGQPSGQLPIECFATDLLEVDTAHFGLTLIRRQVFEKLPHPWFKGEPNDFGRWGEGRVDDDIWFWRRFRRHGFKLFHANSVPIGHAQLTITWPGLADHTDPERGPDVGAWRTIYQWPHEYWERGGPPDDIYKPATVAAMLAERQKQADAAKAILETAAAEGRGLSPDEIGALGQLLTPEAADAARARLAVVVTERLAAEAGRAQVKDGPQAGR